MKTTFFILAFACVPLSLIAGVTGGASSSIADLAEREIVRKQNDIALAERLIIEGRKAASNNDFETAYVRFLDALEMLPAGEAGGKIRQSAIKEFSSIGVRYAEWLIGRGRYSEAEQVAKTILLPRFNPNYKPAAQLLANLEQPDYYNKTVTPEFAAQVDQVNKLLQEADGFLQTGRLDLATKRYEQVLAIDSYNSAARRGLESVNKQRSNYYASAYNETRSRLLWEVTKAWEKPVSKGEIREGLGTQMESDARGTELIQAKLNRIIIPKINLQDTPLSEAVTFLIQQSQRLDTQSEEGKRGVNIVLRLDPSSIATASEEEAAPASQVVSPSTRLSLSLSNVPLFVALKYVAELAGLKVKVEPFAVSLVPISEPTETLITKEYRVPPSFIPIAQPEDPTAGFGPARGEVKTPGPGIGARQDAKKFLEENGITFPPGATARYLPVGSKLIVKNTPDNIDLIDALVDAAVGVKPTQVNIETKFLEVSQNDIAELGFDWLLGPFKIGNGVYLGGGDPLINNVDYPFDTAGQFSMTRGLRSGSGLALTPNSIDTLLEQNTGTGAGLLGPAPAIFGISGIFTNPQFQVLIRALDQKKGVDLLSAPSVTTKSGQRANIKISRRFSYPTQFDPPQIPTTTTTGESGGIIINPLNIPPPTVTPAFPSSFTQRDIGILLEVEPTIGSDSYTIDLNLTPEVVEFDGFVNYGSPITTVGWGPSIGTPAITPRAIVLTDNPIRQPIFSSRKVTTSVTIWDGQTVALGGLMREDVQKVNDKVPILGDIPFAGRLFRSNVDQKIKKNLVIFVTAQIIDAEGRPLRREDEQEEIVEPLGLPERIPGPSFPTFKGSGK
jgi:general secretion pathway protein D